MVAALAKTPVRVVPPARPLSTLRYLRAVVRNPLEVWPEAVYRERVSIQHFLGRRALFVMDPDLVEEVLVRDAARYRKPELMQRLLRPALGGGIVVADGSDWRRQRRIVAPLFRPAAVAAYVPEMLAAGRRTAERLAARPDGAVVPLSDEMMRTAFDVVAETVLAGAGAFDVGSLSAAITTYLGVSGWVIAWAQLGLPEGFPYPGRRGMLRARDHLRRVTSDLVRARRAGGYRQDLVQALIDARDEETGAMLGEEEIVDNLLTFIAAGHETTALALTWTLYLLGLHPEVEARVVAEITAAGGVDLPPEAVADLTYTRQVVSEAMRLYPPAPSLLRSTAEEVQVGGEVVDPQTLIFIPIYAIHRHRLLWTEPDRFDPDRFLPEAAKTRHRFSYLPFGGGPRVCIGAGFAMLEATAILAALLARFRFDPPEAPPVPIAKVTLRPAGGVPARVRRRTMP